MRNSQNRYFYHIFVSPGDAPGAITLNVWMEREFDAYNLSHSVYPSILNSFPVIRTASAKNRRFHVPQPTFFVSPGDAPATITRIAGEDDEMFMTRSLDQRYAKDNRTAHLTARSDKSVAYVTIKTLLDVLYRWS